MDEFNFQWIREGVVTPRDVKPVSGPARSPGETHKKKTSTFEERTQVTMVGRNPYEEKKRPMHHDPRRSLVAKQIMSSPVLTLPIDATFEKAWKLIVDYRFRHVPIATEGDKLFGIISDRDLLREAALITQDEFKEGKTIRNMIKTNVLTASRDSEIKKIAQLFFDERIGSMPIVDEDGLLLGIITRSDILRTIVNQAPIELWT